MNGFITKSETKIKFSCIEQLCTSSKIYRVGQYHSDCRVCRPHCIHYFACCNRYNKADWDSLRTFYSSYPWSSGFSNDPSSFASFITDEIFLGMDLFIPSSYKPGKKIPQNSSIHGAPKL